MNRLAKKVGAVVMSMAVAVSGITFYEKQPTKVKAAVGEYKLVWSDDFDGTSLNRDNWNVEVNGDGSGNGELQYYVDSENNIKVSDGTLKLICRKEYYDGKNYTSGRINSKGKQEFKYGKIEAKMKLPRSKGIWPAFWMLGANYDQVGWPKCGEMDIMEAINNNNNIFSNLHWFVGSEGYTGRADTQGVNYRVNDRTQWHVYGMEWDEKGAKFYVDNHVYQEYSFNDTMEEFTKKQFIIFNLALGGSLPGQDIDETVTSSTMEVDWVKVYQKEQAPTIDVDEDAVEKCTNTWESWVGNGSAGTVKTNGAAKDGVTVNLTAVGNDQWGAQASLKGLPYYKDSVYTYKCTLESDVDKRVFVKVAGNENSEISGDYVDLKAGVPYNYTKEITLDGDFFGTLDLVFGLGKCDGDAAASDSSANITINNLSFKTTRTIKDPNYVEPTTTEPETTTTKEETTTESATVESSTTENSATTKTADSTTGKEETTAETKNTITTENETTNKHKTTIQNGAKKVSSTKITKAKRNGKKISLKFKKVSGAYKYQIRYATNSKFKKAKTKTVKKTSVVLNKINAKKKYYIQVRVIKKTTGKELAYSIWTKIKVVKPKKK